MGIVKPKAQIRAPDGGTDYKVKTAVMKGKRHDRVFRRRKMDAEKKYKTTQDRLTKFTSPVKSLEEIAKKASIGASQDRRIRKYKEGALVVRKRKISEDEYKVILVVRNGIHYTSDDAQEMMHSIGLKKRYWAVFLPNTEESWTTCRMLNRNVFFGAISRQSVSDLLMRRGKLLKAVQQDTVDLASARGIYPTLKLNPDSDFEPFTNKKIEDYMGYLDIICVEDIVNSIWAEANENVLKHLAPFALRDVKMVKEKLEIIRVHGFMGVPEMETLIKRLI